LPPIREMLFHPRLPEALRFNAFIGGTLPQ